MSGFGAFCPLPLRLGGSANEGWTAEQHARVCADLVAAKRSTPVAILNFSKSGTTVTINWYLGPEGYLESDFPVVANGGGAGVTSLTFPTYWEDDYEQTESYQITGVGVSVESATAGNGTAIGTSPNTFDVVTFNGSGTLTDLTATVEVYGRRNTTTIGDYDGASDKSNCETEIVPYAWTWYQEYGGMLGSGFSQLAEGPLHATKLALARTHAGTDRAAEAIANNALPGTSDVMLAEWIDILNVVIHGEESRHEIRQRAASKFKSGRGNSKTDVDNACLELLGGYFVTIFRQDSNPLSSPPATTYWPGINPGPTEYDIGGGAWFSERSHLTVEVTKPAGIPDADWLTLMNVDLYRELSTLLPAWATFNWAVGISDGFTLDVDELDFTGLTPS